MPGPRKKFRERPKKVGAKKKQKVKAQKKRLVSKGISEESLNKMTDVDVRNAQKKAYKRKRVKVEKKPAKK